MMLLAAATATTLCMSADDRDRVRDIMLDGIEAALRQHTIHLYDNLLKDRGAEPERMSRGMHNAVALYLRARETLLKWSPPPCEVKP